MILFIDSPFYFLLWPVKNSSVSCTCTDNGHPETAFFQKFETFGLGQTNWAEILGCLLGIFSQTTSTIFALWVPCPWKSVACSFSYKKLWFLCLKPITPKYSQNEILAVKNLEKSLQSSVFAGCKRNVERNDLKIEFAGVEPIC